MDEQRYKRLDELVRKLTPSQFALVERIAEKQAADIDIKVTPNAPFNQCFAVAFGDALRSHHAASNQPFTKDKFEYALVDAFRSCGIAAEDSGSKTRAGYDVRVDGVQWSLKTQADKGIKPDEIWISKYMEMGRGQWESEADLPGLRDRFLHHLRDYERIFTLRHLIQTGLLTATHHLYELVEIPKSLLHEAAHGSFKWMADSKQDPKPGYCTVDDGNGGCKFEMYFDGGTERKLQIKHLRKKFCAVIATWSFPV